MKFLAGKCISTLAEFPSISDSGSVRLNELNIKAVRNFTSRFKNVSDVKWGKLDKGFFVVSFAMNGIRTRVLYDKTGTIQKIIRDYEEDKLHPDIRHRIKTMFYDFNIYHVTEVNWYDYRKFAYVSAYIAILQDNNTSDDKISWKIVKIEDEMEVIREYTLSTL
jgi:hypothetical protein